jgi:chitin synthase
MIGSSAYLVLQGIHGFVEGKVKLEPERIKERWTQPAWQRRLGLGKAGPVLTGK